MLTLGLRVALTPTCNICSKTIIFEMSTSGLEISSTLMDMHAVFGKEHNFEKHTGMYRHELDR